MKITGAPSDSSTVDTQRRQVLALPVLESFEKVKGEGEVGGVVSTGTPDETLVEAVQMAEHKDSERINDGVGACGSSNDSSLTEEDGEFLDLLCDTLEKDFNPDLLL